MINVIQKKRTKRDYDDNSLSPTHKKRILPSPNDENKPFAVSINVLTENTNISNDINNINSSFCTETVPTDTSNNDISSEIHNEPCMYKLQLIGDVVFILNFKYIYIAMLYHYVLYHISYN